MKSNLCLIAFLISCTGRFPATRNGAPQAHLFTNRSTFSFCLCLSFSLSLFYYTVSRPSRSFLGAASALRVSIDSDIPQRLLIAFCQAARTAPRCRTAYAECNLLNTCRCMFIDSNFPLRLHYARQSKQHHFCAEMNFPSPKHVRHRVTPNFHQFCSWA